MSDSEFEKVMKEMEKDPNYAIVMSNIAMAGDIRHCDICGEPFDGSFGQGRAVYGNHVVHESCFWSYTFADYASAAESTADYKEIENYPWIYPVLGLGGEAGELENKLKKVIRDGNPIDTEDAIKELGDVLWYLSETARQMGISLQEVAIMNVLKLKDRKSRNKIHGSGDNR